LVLSKCGKRWHVGCLTRKAKLGLTCIIVDGYKRHIFTINIPRFHSRYKRYVPVTNDFHEFCWSTISGTLDDRKTPHGTKFMHIFIMYKIRHIHIQYDTRKWRGIKHRLNRAKVWPAGHITLADRPCVGTFPKIVFTTCQSKSVGGVSNVGNIVQGGNLVARPSCMASRLVKWAPCAQSSATTPPYSSYKYQGAPSRQKVWREWGLAPIVLPSSFL
jgi:hypothetical protein